MAKVKAGLTDLPAPALAAKAQSVHNGIVAHPAYFPDPIPAASELQGLIDTLVVANATVSANNGPKEVRERKSAAKAVTQALRSLAGYVQMRSAGNAEVIAASNFEVAQRGGPIGELPPPEFLRSRLTKFTGRASLAWKRQHGANLHHVWMSTSNEPFEWVMVGSTTKRRFNMEGLTPGKFYWFTVSSIGTAGESSKCGPCPVMAAA